MEQRLKKKKDYDFVAANLDGDYNFKENGIAQSASIVHPETSRS